MKTLLTAIVFALAALSPLAWAGEKELLPGSLFVNPSDVVTILSSINPNCNGQLQAPEGGGFAFCWDEKERYVELRSKNIHLRIFESGRVEKLEWKVLNEPPSSRWYYWNQFTLPLPAPSFDHVPSR